jgi:hypothetical protein
MKDLPKLAVRSAMLRDDLWDSHVFKNEEKT